MKAGTNTNASPVPATAGSLLDAARNIAEQDEAAAALLLALLAEAVLHAPSPGAHTARQFQQLRAEDGKAAGLLERILLAHTLDQRLDAAEALVRRLGPEASQMLAPSTDERRRNLPTSLPVGGIITPV